MEARLRNLCDAVRGPGGDVGVVLPFEDAAELTKRFAAQTVYGISI